VSGGFEWVASIGAVLVQKCSFHLEINIEFWIRIDGILVPNPDITGKLCRNDCNGNGACINGKQKCVVS
jgi:hypothetical protein